MRQGAEAREFRAYSTGSLTRACDRPTWADLVRAHIGGCGTQALGSEEGFHGRLATWQVGCLQFVRVNASGVPVRAVTRRRSRGESASDTWLGMCLGGGYELAFQRRVAEVMPAQIAVLDPGRVRAITFAESCDLLWVRVPRVFLPAHLLAEENLVIDGTRGAGFLVRHTLQAIAGHAQEEPLGDTDAIADGVLKLVSAAIAPLKQDSRVTVSAHRAHALSRIKRYVERNLGDEALGLQSVADALGMSPRYVNKLFETEHTSLMRWTWARRLERARFALECGGRRPIGEVAGAFGFKSLPHFSRTFRARFGCTPSQVLEGSRNG